MILVYHASDNGKLDKNIDNYNLGDKACRHRIIISTWFSVAFYYELFIIKKNEP